jgi:hypothetical protein
MSTNEIYCPYCGSISKTKDKFCNNCGASLDLSESIVESPPQQLETFEPIQKTSPRAEGEKLKIASSWLAISSLVLGCISVSFFLIPILDFPIQIGTGVLAILSGIFGIIKKYKRTQAIIGLILGVIGTGLWILGLLTGIFSIWDLF